jgi:hypothetical protein
MKQVRGVWLLCLLELALCAGQAWAATGSIAAGKPQDTQWLELLPESERAAAAGALALPTSHNFLDEAPGQALPQSQAFVVNEALAGRLLRMPGYVVPINLDDKGRVTEFFLVPYYGACIHMPPPPPNQVVYVVPAQPFTLKSLTTPYWVTGQMKIGSKTTRLGAAAYTVTGASPEIYKN